MMIEMFKKFHLILMVFALVSCGRSKEKNNAESINSNATQDSIKVGTTIISSQGNVIDELWQTDTFKNGKNLYVLEIYKRTESDKTIHWFVVKKKNGEGYRTILKDPDYYTSNSGLNMKDCNNDGYLDIIWTKKIHNDVYLFNPEIENFVEVGEFDNVETLKIDNQIISHNDCPLLFYASYDKQIFSVDSDKPWISKLHSELFIINKN